MEPPPVIPPRLFWFLPNAIVALDPGGIVSFSKSPGSVLADVQGVRVSVAGEDRPGALWNWKGHLEDALTGEKFSVCIPVSGPSCEAADGYKSVDAEMKIWGRYKREFYRDGTAFDWLDVFLSLESSAGAVVWRWYELHVEPQECARRIASILSGCRLAARSAAVLDQPKM